MVESQQAKFATRDDVIGAVKAPTALTAYSAEGDLLEQGDESCLAFVVFMPTTVGNEANRDANKSKNAPTIELDFSVIATQVPHEEDSFGSDYDQLTYRVMILIQNSDGSYIAGEERFVKLNDELIPVTADEKVSGLYYDADGNAYTGTSAALKATFANENTDITLIKDFSMGFDTNRPEGTPDTYITTNNAVIDLNGKTLTVTSNDRFFLVGDNITIKNGTIKAGTVLSSGKFTKIAYSLGVTAGSKNAVIEDIVCEGGIEVLGNGTTATLRNVTSTATTYYNIYLAGGATATVENCTFTPGPTSSSYMYLETPGDLLVINSATFTDESIALNHSISKGTIEDNRLEVDEGNNEDPFNI